MTRRVFVTVQHTTYRNSQEWHSVVIQPSLDLKVQTSLLSVAVAMRLGTKYTSASSIDWETFRGRKTPDWTNNRSKNPNMVEDVVELSESCDDRSAASRINCMLSHNMFVSVELSRGQVDALPPVKD